MDTLIEMMAREEKLVYDVNNLMPVVGTNLPNSFFSAAEAGEDVEQFNYDDVRIIDLFNKRKESFDLRRRIFESIQELPSEDKDQLAEYLNSLVDRNNKLSEERRVAYQNIVDEVQNPSFSFEGNEEYKQRIVDLKIELGRSKAAAQYYEYILSYLKSFQRSK